MLSDYPLFITAFYFLTAISSLMRELSVVIVVFVRYLYYLSFLRVPFFCQFGLDFCLFIFKKRHLNVDRKFCAHELSQSSSRCNCDIFIAHNFPVSRPRALFLDASVLGAEQCKNARWYLCTLD